MDRAHGAKPGDVASAGRDDVTLLLMPFLGGSHREWAGVEKLFGAGLRCRWLDLPGFGDAAAVPGYSVAEMAEYVARAIAEMAPQRLVLVGHSMSGKVSAVLARWAAAGDERLRCLEGLVLVATSPPGPEPMTEDKREELLESLGGEPKQGGHGERQDQRAAEQFIQKNTDNDLAPDLFLNAVEDVLAMNRAAWRAWLESGSREDWSQRVGVLTLPVLVVAGDKDQAMGPEAQKSSSMPHWPNGRLATLHSNHLIPLEKPAELARLITEFVGGLRGGSARAEPSAGSREVPVSDAYVELILSARVSSITRQVLEGRADADNPAYQPQALTVTELAQLRAVTERVVPQRGVEIDLAARLDAQLSGGPGDGWRFADLPPDSQAYAEALATLEWFAQQRQGKGWLALDAPQRDELLTLAATGELRRGLLEQLEGVVGLGTEGEPALTGEQMKHWFEELRGDAVKLYVAHPATMSRIGYSGVADGADSEHQTGFVLIGEGEREAWEPLPQHADVRGAQ